MPNLQIRDLPESLYKILQERAKKERRSLSQEAIIALAKGLERDENPVERRRKLLQEIEKNQIDEKIVEKLDPVALIREKRNFENVSKFILTEARMFKYSLLDN